MNINDLYNYSFTEDNMTYSIDMIRLKTYLSFETFSKLEFFIEMYFKDKVKQFWLSNRPMNFHFNYKMEIEEGKKFYFGFHHNSESLNNSEHTGKERGEYTDLYNFTIEFNPNKLRDNELLMYILGLSGDWYIKSYDLAIDIKISILDLIYDISGKAVENINNYGYDNKTIALGKGTNRIKIYNKKKESNISMLGDLTRIEISKTLEDFEIRRLSVLNDNGFFPDIYLNQYVYSLSDYENRDRTLFAILYAVQNGYPIRDLSRVYKNKIKELLEGGYKIKFSTVCATRVLRKTILYYFLDNKKVHFL